MVAMSEARGDESGSTGLKKLALTAVLGLILMLSMGIVAGSGMALLDDTSKRQVALLLMVVGLAATAVSIWGLMHLKPWAGSGEPMAPKTRRAHNLLVLSGALGGLIGVALSIGTVTSRDPFALFSNGPMPRVVVIPTLAIWLLLVPAISWLWHRSVDEHEADAYRFGGLAGLYVYAFLAPAWWLAARADLAPRPDSMIIYSIVLGVWLVGWFWRRYR